jgi:hypothetical protein
MHSLWECTRGLCTHSLYSHPILTHTGNALGASVLARALPALLRQDLKDDAGYTAVDAAAHMGWSKVVDTLVELGAGTAHTAHTVVHYW